MVRETRYLLVGNLPENVTEDEISEYFKRFSKIQSVKIHSKKENEDHVSATVAFADIKSASKANSSDNSIRGKVLTTAYSEGSSATGSVVKRTLDEPRPSYSANRPSSFPQRKGPEDGEVYEGRDYYSRGGESGQYAGYTENEYQRGRPRERFQGRGGFKQFDRGAHHQWTGSQRHFGERSNSSSDRDAFEKPKVPESPARSLSQTSRKSPKMKRIQSNSTSRSRSRSSDSSSSSSYSDSSSDSSRSRSRSGSRSSNHASRSKLTSAGSQVKSTRSRSQCSNASENTETTEGGSRPHGIRITNLPSRSSDTSLRDGLFHEYKKYGKVNAVQISGNGDGRYAIVSFKKSEDARKALVASQEKRFFGTTIRVAEHEGIDVDDAEFRPPEAELDEHHPKATRTLFVGNLEKEITMEELKEMFSKYGEILDIDVKRQGAISAYSFIQFTDIKSVVKALRALDGETMGGMKLKLGFGKSMPTTCVWVDNLADTVQENFLFRQFARYGPLSNMVIDRERGKALIFFNSLENAQFALNEMRNRILNGQKIQIDFASRDCQTDFYDKMEKSGQLKPGQRSTWNYQRQNSDGQQWPERGRGKFPFVRGTRGFVRGSRGQRFPSASGRGYSKDYPEDYRRQRSYDEYSQGGGTPYSEGDFESDLHAYRTQRERQRSCSPSQYSDEMYSESYREYKARYPEYTAGSPGSEPEEGLDYKTRDESFYRERYVPGSREGSPEGSFQGRSWSHSPAHSKVKDSERNTPPTPLGGDDTQDFSSREHSPSDVDGKPKRSGKDDFDITEADIQELRTSNYSSAHRKESLSRSEERYSRKRSYDESFTKDSIPKDDSSVKKLDRQLSHGSHEKLSLSDSKRDLYQKVKKIQSEISGKMLARNSRKEGEGTANSSDSDPGSGTGGDLTKLHHERQVLIEKLKLFEDASNSENEHLDSEGKKLLSKRPRLDPWSSKRLQSELGSVTLGAKKDKSYDVSQSMRKQMEAIRKQEEKSVKDDSGKGSKKSDMFSLEDEKEENFIPHGLLSPKDVPTAFVKKRKKLDTNEENKNRMYRHKRENEEERMSSDNDDSAKNVLRTDSITSIGSNRRLSSGHSSPRTPITGHLSLETIEQRLSESEQSADLSSSMIVKKSDSKRRSKDEHSSPVIIPLGEDLLVTDIPDPRVPKQKREEEFCLPLPKFAEYTPPMKFNSSNSDNSGEHSKENSPCFSPPSSGSKNESPQMSPNDTTSDESQTVSHPEPTYIPEDNSSEHAIETLENQEMEVDKPPPTEGDIDDIMSDSSDHNDDFSLDERIRKLDEKLNQLPSSQPSKLGTENVTSTSSLGINISSSTLPTNVYSKYKIKKRQDSERLCNEETEKSEKPSSEIVKTMLNRSSIFDLDSKRLEQINEKYSPNMKLVVSNAEDSPKSLTLRTKAEAKEMPLSTLPGSLAGRLGNGGTSFPTLSINTQPLVVKIDDKPCNNVSPSSSKLYINDQNSQEGKTADTCSYNSDNRIFTVSDRIDLNNTVTTSFSQRFNSLDNGVNKNTVTTSTRTLVESVIESAEKSDSVASGESNPRDPRLKKDIFYDNMDTNNKKLDLSLDNKVKKSPPILLENTLPKTDLKVEISTKSDSISDNIMDNKSLRSEINSADDLNNDSTISLGKRKADLNSKKDKIKSSDNSSVSSTNSVKDHSSAKSDINSGSESPESKKVKLSSPEKDNKSETNSPTSNDSAKSDKLKKDNDKKSKDSKKKEQSEGDSVNKDKGYNDRKDKDHDGDKTRNSPKNSEQNDKTEDQNAKSQPENNQKETQSKLESKEADKTEKSQTKKESEKNLDHSNTKKEKKSDNSSKKSVEGKNDSSHKKESKSSTESKVKDKTKSSHKNKESKLKDNKTGKDGHLKSHSGKISKSGSAEKVDLAKDVKNSQLKDSSTVVESNDKKEAKESDNKGTEKPAEVVKDIKTEKTSETTAKTEKTSETAPKPEKSSDLSKPEKLTESLSKPDKTESTSKPEKSSEPSSKPEKSTDGTKEKPLSSSSEKPKEKSVESKHKAKSSDNSKPKDKPTDSVKHKTKSESSEHKSKSSHDVMKKDKSDKSKHKDSSKTKEKSASSDTSKSKEKSIDSKTPSVDKPSESENKGKSDSKTTDLEPAKSNEKTEDVKPKEKSGNGASSKVKDKSETDKTKSNEHSSTKPKERTKHSDNGHNKSKGKEEKSKPSTTVDKVKEKSPKDYNKKDDDHSKSDSKKDGITDSKSSGSASKPTSENTTSTEKKEESSSNQDNKADNKTETKSENKNDSKSENSSGNTESMAKNKSDTKKEKERKKSGESSKSSSKSSSKKSSSEKKSDSKSSDKKSSKKDSKKEEKTSPKEEKPKKQPAKKQEVEFDWSAWMDEPYVSMYDRVKRKSSEKDKEREMQEMKNRFNHLAKSRNKKHSKFSETEESDFSHDSDEETDAFEEEKVAKPSKEVSSVHDASAKRKRCVIDTSTSSDDDDSQLFKSFQKSTLNSKEKNKGTIGKSNKHSVNDIYSSDSSETDIDFPPISPAKKKTKKTKKAKKAEIHPDTDSDLDLSVDKLKKKKTVSSKPKPKSTPKKRQEPKVSATLTDTHESDLYDIDSELDIFDRIKLKNQKKNEQKTQSKSTPRKAFETTTDDSDNAMLSPGHKVNMKKKEVRPIQKSFLSDPSLYDMDSDSSFPDLSTITPKNNEVNKINNEIENKKPGVTEGGGVTAQTIRSEDLGQKNDEVKKKEKTKKKSKKNDLIKSDDVKKMGENGKGLFEKMENFISQADPKEKTSTKHSKREGKSQNIRDMGYLDEEEINQAEKLVNNMNKLEKPMKHDPAKVNKTPKHDHEKTSSKTKMRKLDYSFSRETDTDKDTKSQAVSEHEDKSMAESNKEDEKKIDDAASKTKTSKVKKKKPDNAISDVTNKDSTNSFGKKEFGDISKKVNHKIDVEDVSFNKQANKKEIDEGHVKKLPNKLEMDTGPFKQTNKGEKEEGYKIGFGFFEDFPMPENFTDDLLASKKGKKKTKEKEEDFKTNKKEVSKSDEKTPKKKEKKKKDAMSEMKENGPKLEELVGRLARSTQNKDVFDFPEEEDDKPLFAEFFKKKEELAQKDAANKKDKPESKKPLENKLSTEEKLNDASSESLGETDSGRKNGQQESKSISNKTEEKSSVDPKPETEKNEDSIKSGLFSPKLEDGKIEDSSIANMFSPKLVKEACKDEAKNIMAFANSKDIDICKSDDENGKGGVVSPIKTGTSPKGKGKKDLAVNQVDFHSEVKSKLFDIQNKTMLSIEKNLDGLIPTKEETVKPKISGVSAEEEQEKSQMMSNASKQKKTEKFDGKVKEKPENEEKSKVKEKPEIPEKSKEEIMLEAVSSLQKLSENTSAVTPEADSYQEGELVIDETTAAIETVTEEPELTEQAQNETDLAILSILPFDEKGGQFVEPLPQPPAVTEPQPEVAANIIEPESVQITLESATVDTSLEQNELVIDASTPQVEGVNITEAEKLTEKVQKSCKHLKTKGKVEMPGSLTEVEITTPSDQVVKPTQPLNPTVEAVIPSQPAHFQPQMFAHIQDPKLLFNLVPEVQKAEPYRKTRKQKANSKINHHVEVPGTIYPPVYNAVEHVIHLPNSLLGGDASEKENEEKLVQPYNIDTEKHDDMDNLRISGDEGGNSTDKRSRRGRKPQNYKELNSGIHGRTTSPRSRTSPRSPRAGMSPRQALSPLSSPKSELSSPVVKIERLPFGCNKNIRTEGELSNDAISEAKQQIVEAVENQIDYQNLPSTKKIIEEINKTTPVKEGTNVFDFDDNEPEPDTTPLKPTRQKKGRRNTQEAVKNPELKTTVVNQNHIVSPLESRWQCKKDSESEKNGNHPLKLTIALAHSTGLSASITNSIANVINSATIIDSTIPSIKGKKDVENVTKVSTVASSVVSSITPVTTITTTATSVSPKSNVDKIIDDVSKGIFNWAKSDVSPDQNKDQMFMSMPGMIPNLADNDAQQLNKKRNVQGRNLSGEQDMMPPPMTSPPGHEFVPMKSSPNLVQPPASPFGSMTMSLGRPPSVPVAISTISHTTHAQMGEVPLISYSQAKGTSQLLTTKNKPLDMAINMTSRADVMNTAHSLSTAAVVTQTTTTTIAQQSPGTSVVMSTQKPMVTSSGNTTVLAGRTVTVKPPNTEAYLHQMGLHPGGIPTQAPIMAHQTMPRLPENKQAFPPGFLPNFPRPDAPSEHSRPVSAIASTDKQPQVTSSAPTCVVHPITSSSSKTTVDAKLMHQQMMQAVSNRAQTVPTTSSQPIPPAHMQPAQFTMMEKEQLRNMATHGQPMVPVASHMMQNHIQNKQEKGSKGRQSQKGEMPQPNEPIQRPPSAHSQKSSTNEQQRPPSAHDNPALLQEQIRNFVSKGFIPHPQLLQMYHHQQQMAAATAKIEEKKGHKIHPPKEMVSPGIAHQPSSMFATSIASQSSNPQIKSPAVAQTAPSPHPVFSQPSTSQVRPTSPGLKKVNQNHWPSESPVDARNEAQRSRPTSVEPAQSPKHWGFSGTQQPKPAHQHTMDSNTKTNLDLEAVRLYEQHKQQEMLRMQQEQAKIQEIQRQEMQRHQQAMKSREGIPSNSATTSQQSERDRQTASVPGKPRSNHLPNHAESGPSPLNPRNVHPLTDLRGPRAFVSPAGEMIQGIPAHLYQDPEFQQRLHAAAALRMPHLLDAHLYPQGYPLGLPHHYLGQVGGIPLDHPHLQNGRPPSQGGMRSPPPRQAHQAVVKSPAIPNQNRPMPDPGEGSLVSLLQRYPVMWQGTLALKNDSCAVQMHVISGFKALVQTALPQPIIEGTCQPLRIAQRMRLEAAQLEGVIKRMQYDKDYCMLLALPCGSDHEDIIYQTRAMSTGFIQYLQQKQAAGIVNVADPGSQQPAYVVHIFPPCEFSHDTLGRLGFELLHQVRNLSHLLVIITTVA